MLELDDIENPFRTELAGMPFSPDAKGQIGVPTGPGLGIEVNEEVMRKYLVRE